MPADSGHLVLAVLLLLQTGSVATPFAGAAELLAPDARNPSAARRTPSVRAHPLLFDHVPGALDQQVAAIGAVGVLPAADPARKIAGVDELEAGPGSDVARA